MANTIRARSWYRKAWPVRSETGGPAPLRNKPVANAQTFYKGDWVALDTAGRLIYAGAGASYVYGVALEDSIAQTTDTMVRVAPAAPETLFVMQNRAGVASSGLVPGKTADLYITGSGATRIPQLDGAAPVDNVFLIDSPVPDDDTADTTNPGRAYIKVLKSQFTGA